MKEFNFRTTSAALIFATLTLVSQQAIADFENLSLQQAIDVALTNNAEKAVSLQAAVIAESQYQEALAARMPSIDFKGSLSRMDQDPTFTYPTNNIPIGGLSTQLGGALSAAMGLPPGSVSLPSTITVPEQKVKLMDRDTAIASLEVMYPLYTGGKITSIINMAKIAKEIAQEEYHRSTLQVVRDVKRYYYAVQLTKGLTKLAQDTESSMEGTRDLTKSLYEAGTGTVNKLDYLKTEMAVNYTKSLLNEFAGHERAATAALAFAMGVPATSKISVAESDFPLPSTQIPFDEMIKQAQQFNPQMGMMRLAVNIADEKIDEAKSNYYPKVALTGNIRHIENGFDGGLVNDDNKNSWTIGIGVSMPIYDFGRTSNHVNTAKLERSQMAQKQILVEQGLATQIKNLFINLDTAKHQVELYDNSVKVSSQYEQLTEQAYQIGAAKPDDMIQASIISAVLQGEQLRAKHDAAYNMAEIEYFIGNELK